MRPKVQSHHKKTSRTKRKVAGTLVNIQNASKVD